MKNILQKPSDSKFNNTNREVSYSPYVLLYPGLVPLIEEFRQRVRSSFAIL